MEYTIIINGRSYDLPKKTLAVVEKIDSILRVDETKGLSVKQKFEKLHGFVKEMVGEDNATEMFGSSNLSEIDLSEITLATRKIIDAYEKPISDYEAEKRREKLSALPLDQINAVTKAAQTVAGAQMMKK